MAEGKQQHYIFALVGIGGLLVLYFLWRESQAQAPAPAIVPVGGGPQYPSIPIQPINTGDVIINAPPATVYNVAMDGEQLPTVKVGSDQSDCGCHDDDCEAAGLPVTMQTIPSAVVKRGLANVQSFQSKVTSGVQAARITLSVQGVA